MLPHIPGRAVGENPLPQPNAIGGPRLLQPDAGRGANLAHDQAIRAARAPMAPFLNVALEPFPVRMGPAGHPPLRRLNAMLPGEAQRLREFAGELEMAPQTPKGDSERRGLRSYGSNDAQRSPRSLDG
jgi:hypothetical protein